MEWKGLGPKLIFLLATIAHAQDRPSNIVPLHGSPLARVTVLLKNADFTNPNVYHQPPVDQALPIVLALDSKEAVDFYRQAIQSRQENVRIFAFVSADARLAQLPLERIKPIEITAIFEAYQGGVRDSAPLVRSAAVALLRHAPSRESMQYAAQAFYDPDFIVRANAIDVIQDYWRVNSAALPRTEVEQFVSGLLGNRHPNVAECALALAANRPEAQLLPVIRALMASPDRDQKIRGIYKLAEYSSEAAHALKLQAIGDPAPDVRVTGILSLRSATTSQLNAALLEVMKKNDRTDILAVSKLLQSELRGQPSPRVRHLLEIHPLPYYREAAIHLLLKDIQNQKLTPPEAHALGLRKLQLLQEALAAPPAEELNELGIHLYMATIAQDPAYAIPPGKALVLSALKKNVATLLQAQRAAAPAGPRTCAAVPLASLIKNK